jgi:hypothetical protein
MKNIAHLIAIIILVQQAPLNSFGEVWLVVELGQQIKHGLNNPTPRLVP